MAKSKRRRPRRKTRRGGARDTPPSNPILKFVLICHGGNQSVTSDGQLDDFTVPSGMTVAMYVPPGETCVSHLETPLTICRMGISQERYNPKDLCPQYSLSTTEGESGGLYGCWDIEAQYTHYIQDANVSTFRPVPILTMDDGMTLQEVVDYIRKHPEYSRGYDAELRCYFCRTNESTSEYNDVLDRFDEHFADEQWNDDDEVGFGILNTTE
jgi:hypothetical protein